MKITLNRDVLCAHLAQRSLPKSKQVKALNAESTAEHFARQFDVRTLFAALKDSTGDAITMEWLVRRKLRLLNHPEAKVSDIRNILDDLEGLLMAGAIQDKQLAALVLQRTTTQPSTVRDPFCGDQATPFKVHGVHGVRQA